MAPHKALEALERACSVVGTALVERDQEVDMEHQEDKRIQEEEKEQGLQGVGKDTFQRAVVQMVR